MRLGTCRVKVDFVLPELDLLMFVPSDLFSNKDIERGSVELMEVKGHPHHISLHKINT